MRRFFGSTVNSLIIPDAFVFTVKTDNAGTSASNQFTIPTNSSYTYNYNVDWGDGSTSTGVTGNITHTFPSVGEYTVSITGTFPQMQHAAFSSAFDCKKIISVSNIGDVHWQSFEYMFSACSNIISFNAGNANTSLVNNFRFMFFACNSMQTIDITSFDTSSATNMAYMFEASSSMASLDLSNFNTSNVTSMERMLRATGGTLIGIEDFNITSLTNANAFLLFRSIPTLQYNNLLVNWEAQNVNNNVSFGGGNSTYTAGGPAATARQALIDNHSWTITDGGLAV